MSQKKQVTFEECMENVQTYIKRPENIELIQKAYDFAYEHHKGQFRKSGEPYVIHVIQVANTLALMHCGPKTIAAGLLHDTVEDCQGVTTDTITELFGQEIATLVDAVTKIGAIKFKDEEEYLASNHRKLFIAMAKDIRVILIKLADRLHNMRTLQYMRPEKQKKIARETLSVYAPIAHRLGISEIKNELEDLSFKYLDYKKYEEIKDLVKQRESDRNEQVHEMISDIESIMQEYNIQYRIFGRSKHFYSIYKKMVTKNKRFEEILDLLAIRIVTDSVVHCYEILGYIHAKYRPIPGRFKDYIAMPKANMYQSLHTTIVEPEHGNIFEIQIRTEEMDAIAERGVAAHWKYKENRNYTPEYEQKEIEDKLSWFRDFSMMTDEESEDPLEYMNVLQKDIFEANVYCLTPRGKVIALPSGSCPIDFAYRIHTEVGNKTVGAKVNGAIVPLNTPLKTGDVVDILTNNNSVGPSADWIKIVKSGHARNKIRTFLQKQEQQSRKESIKLGQSMLEDEFRRLKLDPKSMDQKRLESILTSLSFKSVDDLYVGIAMKRVSLQSIVDRLVKNRSNMLEDQEIMKIYNKQPAHVTKHSSCGVIVPGVDTIAVSLANCCRPIPGDSIIGYISKGQGVKVHRADCPNIVNEKKRLIPVQWEEGLDEKQYEVNLIIHSDDRNYLLSDIVTTLQQCNVYLKHVDSAVDDGNLEATTKLTVSVKNAAHLQNLISNLKKVRSVNEVIRTIQ
ncbi:RelA/SpoT family protein [Holdemanella biformis]|jgi:guanosine-3',5'-bis(diphosphate) 3'-pyrophosphohydrolase|uniref:RelA/SpoT family protein n=1 Tax=Holdemanella biformis TaxID=1735 RepID=UPI001896F3E4|nr:bifunctional (p)ppGpp synthetase/guanosine-3',5'-bis(diphosphate) 3'-pyrophosphohydrolase [Holdemanella biformis]MBV4131662.1 bifunctional (p)ppGpp synthetase/guanosine-3',5'-bis(diphosphate) 3'-pyrophosphohydrolase [Holdemanella biformis]MBV4151395.1 bifunctional (p)ppGpp synthetase/guanosine-3',5'-bis(diphosphate) 3'-pyrophosphohydrolase [Holdemanella biformis]MEE0668584.1 bifunctional (p)ppGpp synthetase/guanosine-3',5'-bis(diphosphate) 3'-pyrophosphohydrolase [Holdemanella biformis]